MLAHGLFDWLLMVTDRLSPMVTLVIYAVFIWGDIKLWKLGLKYIRKQQENSRLQAEEAKAADMDFQINETGTGFNTEYRQIDWNAGDRR